MPKTVYPFKRIKTSVADQQTLKDAGYTPFFSSNVSAGQRDGSDLYIRFHNGSVYKYPNQGENFSELIVSGSKGKWVWANLRRTKAPFTKVGGFPLAGDIDLTDEEIITLAKDKKIFSELIKLIGEETVSVSKASLGIVDKSFLTTVVSNESVLLTGIIASNIAGII